MSRASLITIAVLAILPASCAPRPQQEQSKVIPDVDKWFKAERGFGPPEKFTIEHEGKTYLVMINCPYSGRAATYSYILEKDDGGYVLVQKLHHPEGSIAHSVKLEHGALVFKGHNDRSVLWYFLGYRTRTPNKPDAGDGK